ncbi:hypothetical protein [Paenibacillus darwinianus]|nr:hypothetical protein [Paenibacillus darwinianus]
MVYIERVSAADGGADCMAGGGLSILLAEEKQREIWDPSGWEW